MATEKTANNPITFRRGVGVGSGNAETDDDFLFDCFVDYPAVQSAESMATSGMILAGRTGAGKTAIIRRIERLSEHSVVLDPSDMAMSYVANSDALRFLDLIGADLDLMFQVLWKHVLCIEFIRLKFSVENSYKSSTIFSRISDHFKKDERKVKSIAYLRQWEGKFWITMDQNIRELTEGFEKKLKAEIGADIEKFKAGGQYEKRLSVERKSEIISRIRKIISQDQLAELHGVIDILSTFENTDQMKAYYILVDRLDERWVDDSVRFRLIRGLMETLRSFRKIRNLKVIVALRSDVVERVLQETEDISFQREKLESYKIELTWSKDDLRALIDKRFQSLFKRKYTKECVGINDVFPPKIGSKDTFDWLLERTLMRPRDVIAFVNECIDAADGHNVITVSAIRRAEIEYSRKRRDALLQEWRSAYPTLEKLISALIKVGKPSLSLQDLYGDGELDDFCLSVCGNNKIAFDPFFQLCHDHIEDKGVSNIKLAQEAVAVLYRTGVIGVKFNAQDRMQYAHLDQPLISPDILSSETRIRLHPMLWGSYNLQGQIERVPLSLPN